MNSIQRGPGFTTARREVAQSKLKPNSLGDLFAIGVHDSTEHQRLPVNPA